MASSGYLSIMNKTFLESVSQCLRYLRGKDEIAWIIGHGYCWMFSDWTSTILETFGELISDSFRSNVVVMLQAEVSKALSTMTTTRNLNTPLSSNAFKFQERSKSIQVSVNWYLKFGHFQNKRTWIQPINLKAAKTFTYSIFILLWKIIWNCTWYIQSEWIRLKVMSWDYLRSVDFCRCELWR